MVFLSLSLMRKCLRIALNSLGLSDLSLTLGGFRPGGASHLFQESRNVPAIQFLGRWKQPGSLTHYLQEAMSLLVQCNASTEASANMRYLVQQLSFVDVIPPRPACFFFSHKTRRSATVMSGGLPPSCHDAGAQLRCREADPRGGPHAGAAQACSQPEVQRGVVARARCGPVCGEVSAKGRRAQLDVAEVLRETVDGGPRTCRLAPPLFAGPSRPSAPLEGVAVSKSFSPEHSASHSAMHYIGSADERDSSGESSDDGWTLSPRRRSLSLGTVNKAQEM